MHNFSIQDKTVTFQYENAILHVSISQRSLINTPVLRSENTLSKAIRLSLMAIFKKYMQAIYTAPDTLLCSKSNHRNQSNQINRVDIEIRCCSVINTFQLLQLVAPIAFLTSLRSYLQYLLTTETMAKNNSFAFLCEREQRKETLG